MRDPGGRADGKRTPPNAAIFRLIPAAAQNVNKKLLTNNMINVNKIDV
jgi:hypothetical protein